MRRLLDAGDLLKASDANAILHQRPARDRRARHRQPADRRAALAAGALRDTGRSSLPGRSERSLAEHTAIVDAIAAGDGDARGARRCARHLSHVAEALRQPGAGP